MILIPEKGANVYRKWKKSKHADEKGWGLEYTKNQRSFKVLKDLCYTKLDI